MLAGEFIATNGNTPINMGIGHLGVALAFGLTVMTMDEPLKQIWLFWVALIAGATIAGVVYPFIAGNGEKK